MKQMKRWLSCFLVFCLIISVMPVTALAASSGSCGDNLTWTLGEGLQATLTISGTGPMYDYWGLYYGSGNHAPWWNNGTITRVIINEGVTSIGSGTFARCQAMWDISIPGSVVSIGDGAFEDCIKLSRITIPEGITKINRGTFLYCTMLHDVNLPESLTTIEENAFYNCTNLVNIMLPENLESIADQAFAHCEYLDTVSIPSGVRSIAPKAFVFCKNLKSISVDESNSVYSNDDLGVLYDKTKSSLIRVPEGLDTVFSFANSITEIGECAFYNCDNLESIAIPEGISIIKEETFYSCSALTSLTLPASVKRISSDAFQSCDNLTDVYYGGSETEWDELAIYSGNDNLKNATIHFNSTGPSTDDGETDNGEGSTDDSSITTQVRYFREWDAENQIAYFDNDVLLGSQVTGETDTSFLENVDNLVGHYVLAETKARDDSDVTPNTLISIKPVDTKTGTVTAADEETITIDGVTYPNGITNIVESADGNGQVDLFDSAAYVDKFVLYHISEGELVGIEALVTEEGSLISWNAETRELTIDPVSSDAGETVFKLSSLADEDTLNTLNGTANPYTTVRYIKDSNNIVYKVTVVTTPDDGEGDNWVSVPFYRASLLADSVTAWDTEYYLTLLDDTSPSSAMVTAAQENGFSTAANAWKAITDGWDTADDISNASELHFEQKDIYSAIILTALEVSVESDFADNCELLTEDTKEFTSTTLETLKASYGLGVLDYNSIKNFTPEQLDNLKADLDECFKEEFSDIEAIDEVLDGFSRIFDGVDTIETYVEQIYTYITLYQMTDSMKAVVKEMYAQTPQDAEYYYMRLALKDCVDILESSTDEFWKTVNNKTGVNVAGRYAIKTCLSMIWDEVKKAASPELAVLLAAYKAGKFIGNQLFNADEINEAYYKMLAVLQYEEVATDTISGLEQKFGSIRSTESAEAFLDSINLLYKIAYEDCDLASGFINAVDDATASKILSLLGAANHSEQLNSIANIRNGYELDRNSFLTDWIFYLEADFPELYEKYAATVNVPGATPVRAYEIACPVNVFVYDEHGELVAAVKNKMLINLTQQTTTSCNRPLYGTTAVR